MCSYAARHSDEQRLLVSWSRRAGLDPHAAVRRLAQPPRRSRAHGLVERHPHPDDRRRKLVTVTVTLTLTTAGREAIATRRCHPPSPARCHRFPAVRGIAATHPTAPAPDPSRRAGRPVAPVTPWFISTIRPSSQKNRRLISAFRRRQKCHRQSQTSKRRSQGRRQDRQFPKVRQFAFGVFPLRLDP
jgi:DNA-binding MarR family transcriptional regulator